MHMENIVHIVLSTEILLLVILLKSFAVKPVRTAVDFLKLSNGAQVF